MFKRSRLEMSAIYLTLLTLLALPILMVPSNPFCVRDAGSNVHRALPKCSLPSSLRLDSRAPSSLSDPPTYNEQLGISFTQGSTSLAYTVTAVEQSDIDGYGPAYLLNGLTNTGYWYQVGLSYNWPYNSSKGYVPGYNLNYEVFDPLGNSIFPVKGGGLIGFSGQVRQGDVILLNLYFSNSSQVVMLAEDRATDAQAFETYSAKGATSFVGTPSATANSKGFFTGLMTEWYHSKPYYGNEQKVVYSGNGSAISSAWMWISEFNFQNENKLLFSNYTLVSYIDPDQHHELSSNGATEYSNAYEFITGSLSAVALTLSYSVAGGGENFLAPVLTYIFNGAQRNAALSSFPITYYADVGTSWSVSNPLGGSTYAERWQTDQPTNGIANSSGAINLAYYHQYWVSFGFSVLAGGSGYSAPVVTYGEFGTLQMNSATTAVWADAASYSYPASLSGSSPAERWATNSTTGFVSSAGTIMATYYHQFLLNTSYYVVGGGSPGAPALHSTAFGSPFSQVLTAPSQGLWIDDGVAYSLDKFLPSSGSERWESNSTAAEGTMDSPKNISIPFFHQYYVLIQWNVAAGGSISLGSGWFDAGATLRAIASAHSGWEFEGWDGSGGGSYSGKSYTANMVVNAPLAETATFYPGLTITTANEIAVAYGYGSVAGTIPAGTSRIIFAPPGTDITLTASPTSFLYSFAEWSGAKISSDSAIHMILSSPLSVQASSSLNYLNMGILCGAAAVVTVVIIYTLVRRRRRPLSPI
jgi:hypothetical protein